MDEGGVVAVLSAFVRVSKLLLHVFTPCNAVRRTIPAPGQGQRIGQRVSGNSVIELKSGQKRDGWAFGD
jgi:hypothetical protein